MATVKDLRAAITRFDIEVPKSVTRKADLEAALTAHFNQAGDDVMRTTPKQVLYKYGRTVEQLQEDLSWYMKNIRKPALAEAKAALVAGAASLEETTEEINARRQAEFKAERQAAMDARGSGGVEVKVKKCSESVAELEAKLDTLNDIFIRLNVAVADFSSNMAANTEDDLVTYHVQNRQLESTRAKLRTRYEALTHGDPVFVAIAKAHMDKYKAEDAAAEAARDAREAEVLGGGGRSGRGRYASRGRGGRGGYHM
jgi:hypothetical protein